MTTAEILAQLTSGKISASDAAALIEQTRGGFAGGDGVSLTTGAKMGGLIRVRHRGAQVDLTAAQAVAVLTHADAVRALIARHADAVATSQERDGRKPGDTYTLHYLGDLRAGYSAAHVETVKAFAKPTTTRKSA